MDDGEEHTRRRIRNLLEEINQGDKAAFDALIGEIYPELKRLARRQLAGERRDHTLSTTAVVHEAFTRLADSDGQYADRAHVLRTFATIMRHLLIDYARRRNAGKRGANAAHITLDSDRRGNEDDTVAVLALDAALEDIRNIDPRLEKIIECRCFAGMGVPECAVALGMSTRSVERHWRRARAYLATAMEVGTD